jgi:hypothetical protein
VESCGFYVLHPTPADAVAWKSVCCSLAEFPVDSNGKGPVDSSADWFRTASERQRSSERHRVRRRARRPNNIRAKIRVRMWLACTGALLVMAIVIYLAIGRERPGESGAKLGAALPSVATLVGVAGTLG